MNNGLAFSPDDSILASAQPDTTILLWDVSEVTHHTKVPKALESKGPEQLWTDLASEDAGKGYQALWTLSASPKEATRFLSLRLKPIKATRPERIRQLIADLDSQSFRTREEASKELTRLGPEAEPAFRTALKKDLSAEARRRVEAILITPPDRLVHDPEILRGLRAIQALEFIGTLEARQILQELAKGATGAMETQKAQKSLARLGPDRPR
jgi:hypothetical protein